MDRTNQILAELNEIEQMFLNKTMNQRQIVDRFDEYRTMENMTIPAVSQKIIELLIMGITDPHHEERLFQYGNIQFMVDVELFDLIGLLHELDIFTKYSCQGDCRNEGYISFANRDSFMKFTKVCKAMNLIGMDVIANGAMHIINNLEESIPINGTISIRFDNKDIGAIYNSIRKVPTKKAYP